ncbi:unnamed protein product [Lathyrus sativus]|nr:unnamed protein product [Lathyrus sativus]
MEKYFKRKSTEQSSTPTPQTPNEGRSLKLDPPIKKRFLEFGLEKLPNDPDLRPKMSDYYPVIEMKLEDIIWKRIFVNQKKLLFHKENLEISFVSLIQIGIQNMVVGWNIVKVRMLHIEEHKGCGDAFITEGLTNWKKSERFRVHIGDVNSSDNQAWRNCQALMKQKQHTEGVLCKQFIQVKEDYQIYLTGIIVAFDIY